MAGSQEVSAAQDVPREAEEQSDISDLDATIREDDEGDTRVSVDNGTSAEKYGLRRQNCGLKTDLSSVIQKQQTQQLAPSSI